MPRPKHRPIPELTEADKARFWSKIDLSVGPTACHPWTAGKSQRGYGKFVVQRFTLVAHRVAYYLSRGVDPGDLEVCHNCPAGDNPACCNDNHLWLGTQADNNADCKQKGRNATGDKNGARKHPEKWKRGEDHHVRKHPELMLPARDMLRAHPELHARGDSHWTRLYPESVVKGEDHNLAKLTTDQVIEIRRRHALGGVSYADLGKEFHSTKENISCIVRGLTWKHLLSPH